MDGCSGTRSTAAPFPKRPSSTALRTAPEAASGKPARDQLSDPNGTYIYAATANGTLFDPLGTPLPSDIGDSLIKLDSSNLHVLDFFAPPDVLIYPSTSKGVGYCKNDFDFGSGGVLLFPDAFYNNNPNLMVNADKESYLTVTDRTNLGKYSASGNNSVQYLQTPIPPDNDPLQGYWGSPAYWKYTPDNVNYTYMLYYAATTENSAAKPKSINAYQLLTTGSAGPIPASFVSTPTLFCPKSPTPSVSSHGASPGSGIVWAIEHGNANNLAKCDGNPSQAALHAFNATTLAKLYDSRGLAHHTTGSFTTFSTPTIFNGYVYMGTQTGVHVFGLCSSQQAGCPLQ
jgi:hypothetical protein